MAGFWDATSGIVRYGGKDIKDIPFDQLMQEISYVAQDNFLFNKSIRENIRMGKMCIRDSALRAYSKFLYPLITTDITSNCLRSMYSKISRPLTIGRLISKKAKSMRSC